MPVFGVVFLKKSQPLTSDNFTQVDATHWVLDLAQQGVADYTSIRDVSVFLTAVLPPDAALTVHVQAGASEWEYRGALCNDTPSDVFPLQWPRDSDGNWQPGAKIGVTLEPLADVAGREVRVLASKEEFAKLVALDLFRYMESFPTSQRGDQLLVPTNVIERWFSKFQEKFRHDPDFLMRTAQRP